MPRVYRVKGLYWEGGLQKRPWVSIRGVAKEETTNLYRGGGLIEETIGIYQGVVGLKQIPWVSVK